MIDMAVGVIIGTAFGGVVNSVVNDIIMPPLGAALSGVNLSELALVIKPATETAEAVTLNYGNFLQTFINFIFIALSVFLMVKIITSARKRFERKEAEAPPPPAAPPREEVLLTEIRDLLAQQAEKKDEGLQ